MNYKIINDYELLYMVRENDDASRDILFEKYLPIIKSIAYEYYQKFKNYGYDYDDFVQEATIAFQKSVINYNESKDVLFYTFTVLCIRRNLLTFCRNITNMNKNTSINNFVDLDSCSVVDFSSSVDFFIEDREIESLIRKLILDLSFENGCIFELKLNGFSYREIGSLLSLPSSTVEFKNRAAKKKLKFLLEKYCKEKTV